jgi:serine/threonine protein phosphatase PrpC
MTTVTLHCPACQSVCRPDDQFCEHCGAALPNASTAAQQRDRIELDLGVAAAVSDRGLVHGRNEDSFRLELGPDDSIAVVVCDGTSSASAGNAAAKEAAIAAAALLSEGMADPALDASEVMAEAIRVARDAVACVPWTTRTRRVDPSCTIVSALRRGGEVVVGWVGDSRAYWIDEGGVRQLTVDDSFAAEGVARGLLTPEQAAKSPYLHAITHWVGPNSPDRPPNVETVQVERRSRLLLCTDGLWNYVPTTEELSALLDTVPPDASPLAMAGALVDAALAHGGHDNVTVAVVEVDPVG